MEGKGLVVVVDLIICSSAEYCNYIEYAEKAIALVKTIK